MTATKYRISNIFRRLGAKSDPWENFGDAAIPTTQLEKALL
jgi:hypothetical protein